MSVSFPVLSRIKSIIAIRLRRSRIHLIIAIRLRRSRVHLIIVIRLRRYRPATASLDHIHKAEKVSSGYGFT